MIPESYVSLTEDLVGQSGWETKTGFQNLDPGTYKLVFLWRNDDWGGSNVAAMIDNVKIEKLSNEPNVSFATSLEFPLTEVGGSATATLTVTNTGGGDLNISGISFSNPDFELADAVEFPDVIASVGGEKSYKIKFTPSSEGEITGTMTIQSNAPEMVVSLSGSGYTHIEITDEAPLFEDFNDLDESQPNMGLTPWTLKAGYATGFGTTQWLVGSDYACDGTSLQAEDAPSTATTLLISPKLYIPADRYAKISFYMRRSDFYEKENEGFKVYINEKKGDIYNYDNNGQVVVNADGSVTTLVEPILHATRYDSALTEKMYQVESYIPAEYSGKEFYVIIEAIQELGSANYIDNLKIELVPNTPLLESSTQSIDLGFVRAGETASQEFTLTNIGVKPLTVSFSQKQTNSPFSITPESGEINFNEQKTFTVHFSSSEVGQFSDELYILTNSNSDTIALKAETYPTTSYYESFDASTSLPAE